MDETKFAPGYGNFLCFDRLLGSKGNYRQLPLLPEWQLIKGNQGHLN